MCICNIYIYITYIYISNVCFVNCLLRSCKFLLQNVILVLECPNKRIKLFLKFMKAKSTGLRFIQWQCN